MKGGGAGAEKERTSYRDGARLQGGVLFDNQWIEEEIKGEIKMFLETNENGNATSQSW